MIPSHRIVYNTGILYLKLLVVMIIGLVNVRLVLGALGETDYGIFSLVAGVIGMLAIMQSAMSNASMRFMAHSLGSGDDNLISKTFNTTLFLHFIIGIIVVVIIEAGGFFMFEYLLDLPTNKVFDAKIVFHFMVITSFITIIAVPYDAVINSRENLLVLSLVDIFGAILKLGVAIFLTYSRLNLLLLYSFSLLIIQIILRIIKQQYSIRNYKECKINFKNKFDKKLAKTILSFSGWNLFASIASISVTQVKSLLLNMFFGVKLNAANGVAMQVSGQVNMVSASMTRALNPQLVKSEGGGDRNRMLRLTELATKYSIFLFALFAIPVIIEMPYLFKLWLKEVPDFAIIFSRLILIGLFLDKFTFEITSAIRAVGNIRSLTVMEAIIAMLNIPTGYLFFKLNYPPYTIYIISILISIFTIINRFYFGKNIAGININHFLKKGIFPVLTQVILASLCAFLVSTSLKEGIVRLFIVSASYILILASSFWFFGLTEKETLNIKLMVQTVLKRRN